MSEFDQIVSDFLRDAPPGETKNVISDLQLIFKDPSIVKSIEASLEKSLTEGDEENPSFEIVELPGSTKLSVISKHNLKGSKFYDSHANKLFHVQFLDNKVIDVEDYNEELNDEFIIDLVNGLKTYATEHYPTDSQKKLAYQIIQISPDQVLVVLANTRYNPANFLNARWLSYYIFGRDDTSLKGEISVDIHYFEDGNVRLKSKKKVDSIVDSPNTANIITSIKIQEEEFEKALNKKFLKLNEVDFKSLRRQLPVTRSRINWGSAIGNYRLGKDVNSA